MPDLTFRGGRLPNDPAKPRLRLSQFLTTQALAAPPAQVDWDAAVDAWPMYGNDRYGDCVFAAIGHAVQAWTANAGTQVTVTDGDVLAAYSAVTGFDPADPATDQGAVIQDALSWWRKTGIAGHRILAFAEVDHTSEAELQQATALFGVVLLGISFPASAMAQFNAGQPWEVVADDGGIEGGHAIIGARYDQPAGQWYWITWGAEHPVTFAFISRYLEEAWVAASPEWVSAAGGAPSGLDVTALNAAFTELTGEPGPFTDTPPVDPPVVVPPLPVGLADALQALAGDRQVHHWLTGRHRDRTEKHLVERVQHVLDAYKEVQTGE